MRHPIAPTLLILASALAGCRAGQDYGGPPAVADAAIARGDFARAGDATTGGAPAPAPAAWWDGLDDPLLSRLVRDALANSPSIARAQAGIAESRARIGQARAGLLPSLSASAIYAHADIPGASLGGLTAEEEGGGNDNSTSIDFYNIGANASWQPDLFGGGARRVEAARATLAQRGYQLADAQVQLAAQVAQSYVNLRDAQERARLNAASVALLERQVALTRARYEGGTASQLDIDRLRTQLRSTSAQTIPLDAQIAAYKDALAVLTGRVPGELDARLGDHGAVPLPPERVAIGDPAGLIARRPDIRAAERALAAGSANVGVAQARKFPGISFTGVLGLGGTDPDAALDPGNLATILLPMLNWSVLDFGANAARVREARAQADQAAAQYRQTVLEALQNAEDSLARFGATRRQWAELLRARDMADNASRLTRARFQAGTTTLIDQLDVERQALSAATAAEQARAQLTVDYISVMMELGLGWQPLDTAPVARGE